MGYFVKMVETKFGIKNKDIIPAFKSKMIFLYCLTMMTDSILHLFFV